MIPKRYWGTAMDKPEHEKLLTDLALTFRKPKPKKHFQKKGKAKNDRART